MSEPIENQTVEAHVRKQREAFDKIYDDGSRRHVTSQDEMIQYIVAWRIRSALKIAADHMGKKINFDSSILFGCAGEGGEASICCDLGFTDVTFSDISPMAVAAGLARDSRLKGLVLDAENLKLSDNSYDIVIVQDGLHHLASPTRGFTEMLRVTRGAAILIEPHRSLIGDAMGTKWERHGDAINYVFRWDKRMAEDIACSFLGRDSFDNLSYSYWHHNVVLAKCGQRLGGGRRGAIAVSVVKWFLDHLLPGAGNQFTGIIVKSR